MKSSESLRLIVRARRVYRLVCSFLLRAFATRPDAINPATASKSTLRTETHSAPIQKTMSPSVIWAAVGALLGLGAAICGGIALVLSWQEGNAKDDAAGKLATENQAKFLGLEKQASDAKSAQQTVETELIKTKIQLAQTERKIGPRRVDTAEKEYLLGVLKDAPKVGRIYVTQYDGFDGEAWDFAKDLIEVLMKAGFTLDQKAAYKADAPTAPPAHMPPEMRERWLARREEHRLKNPNRNFGIELQLKSRAPGQLPGWVPYLSEGLWQLGYRLHDGPFNMNAPEDVTVIEVGEKPKYPEN